MLTVVLILDIAGLVLWCFGIARRSKRLAMSGAATYFLSGVSGLVFMGSVGAFIICTIFALVWLTLWFVYPLNM